MEEIFLRFAPLILFLHVLGGIVWIGGMIAIRLSVHPGLMEIKDDEERVRRTLAIVLRFFDLVIPFIIIILLTGLMISLGMGLSQTPLAKYVHIKEGIWTIMALVFVVIYTRAHKARRAFANSDVAGAKKLLAPIARYLLPTNIVLGILALAVGITLRGF